MLRQRGDRKSSQKVKVVGSAFCEDKSSFPSSGNENFLVYDQCCELCIPQNDNAGCSKDHTVYIPIVTLKFNYYLIR